MQPPGPSNRTPASKNIHVIRNFDHRFNSIKTMHVHMYRWDIHVCSYACTYVKYICMYACYVSNDMFMLCYVCMYVRIYDMYNVLCI